MSLIAPAAPTRPASPERRFSRPLVLILFTVFLDVVGLGVIIPVAPFYATSFGATALDVGLLFTAFAAAQFLATPVLGALSDRFGRRPVLLVSILGEAIGYLMLGLAPSLPFLYLARVVSGATAGNIGAAQAYVADISSPADRTRTFGLLGAAFGVGFLFGPAMGGALSQWFDLRTPALASAVLVTLNLIFVWLWLPESLPPERRTRDPIRSRANPFGVLAALLARPVLRAPMLATFLVNLGFSGMQTNLAVYLSDRFGFGPGNVAQLFVALSLVSIATQVFVVGRLSRRFSDTTILVLGLAATALAYLGIAWAPSPAALWPVVALQALGSALWRPALSGLVSKLVSPREQGVVNGGSQGVTSLASVLGPILAGVAYSSVSMAGPYVLGALATGVAAVAMMATVGARPGATPQAAAG